MRVIGIALMTGLLVAPAACKGSASNLAPGTDGNDGDRDGGSTDDAGGRIDASLVPDATPAPYCTPRSGTNLALRPIVSGIVQPVFVTAPPRDPRLFVLERRGRILIVEDGVLLTTAFLDLDQVTSGADRINDVGDERGLLGLAFHPEFASNGRFYIHYTANRATDAATVNIAEYRASPPTADVAEPTGRVVLRVPHKNDQHNGGTVQFGPDGYLYISIGDNGEDAAPRGTTSRLGKILRIDVDNGDPYGIPDTNPYRTSAAPEAFALGLRNPYRFSIDPQTSHIFIGDVGEGAWEEIDVIPGGRPPVDFGWPACEGPKARGSGVGSPDCAVQGVAPPTFAYSSVPDDVKAVIGGVVYRGACMPDMGGQYFFADNGLGRIQTFAYQEGQTPTPIDHGGDYDLDLVRGNVSSFGTDGFGELYVTALGFDPLDTGVVYRVEVD